MGNEVGLPDSSKAEAPYYQDDLITLYHGDCRELLPSLGAQADALITDPPYGVGMKAFDDDFDASVAALNLAPGRIAAIFMTPRRVPELVAKASTWHYERLLWMHKTADMAAPWRGWCMNSEAIVIASRPDAAWPKPTDYRSDVYSIGPWERSGHPNAKPLSVMRDLVRRLCAEAVIDPFAGSGTTLRAAKDLGKRAIGIEISERYCEIAAERLSQGVLDFGEAS